MRLLAGLIGILIVAACGAGTQTSTGPSGTGAVKYGGSTSGPAGVLLRLADAWGYFKQEHLDVTFFEFATRTVTPFTA
jgi:hypothetical protein